MSSLLRVLNLTLSTCNAVNALVDALDASTGATPALRVLARPRYPMRELRPQARPDGSVALSAIKRGWEYKYRGPRPTAPPPADTGKIMDALNAALPPGLTITAAVDHGEYIIIIIMED